MQESQHEREGIGNKHFRFLTGLVGLAALSWIAVEPQAPLSDILENGVQSVRVSVVAMGRRAGITDSLSLILMVTAPAGWGGLVYARWIRSGRITGTALAFVLALGVCGMVISAIAFDAFQPVEIVVLTGTWILNGLGIVWIVHKVRRIKAVSNTDEADAAR